MATALVVPFPWCQGLLLFLAGGGCSKQSVSVSAGVVALFASAQGVAAVAPSAPAFLQGLTGQLSRGTSHSFRTIDASSANANADETEAGGVEDSDADRSGGGRATPFVPAAVPLRSTTVPPTTMVASWRSLPRVSTFHCEVLQRSLVLDPTARCRYTTFAVDFDGCVCTVKLPRNVQPAPDLLFDPFPEDMPDSDVPTAPPMKQVPPPLNPVRPYVAPVMLPTCPFATNCSALPIGGPVSAASCVGYDTWGFGEVRTGGFSPASGYLNQLTCSYIMKPGGRFIVPYKVATMMAQHPRPSPTARGPSVALRTGFLATSPVSGERKMPK
eukprot:TRINITY_DN67235_c0_g1_i1.p1 TRINITY_DN67235_c0_g1~~TRINITY_DN67235_c0_g1_i1.p1  ORF type:complete len:328 (-),score=37.76 TRINITY_DN67235_c0_g1_i1:57-1040(-)